MNPQRDCTPDYSRCCHVKQNGARCTMPALHGHQLCCAHYQRQERLRRQPRAPQWSDHMVPIVLFNYMEDHASILANLNAAADAFARHDIDFRQLSAITRFFETCLRTLRQMHRVEETLAAEDMVRDVVTTDSGELQALPDPGPATATSPAADPVAGPRPDSPSLPDSASGAPATSSPATSSPTTSSPAPSAGVVPAICACADPGDAAPARLNPPSQPSQDLPFQSFNCKNPINSLFSTLSETQTHNPFIAHTYVFEDEKFSRTAPALLPSPAARVRPHPSERTGRRTHRPSPRFLPPGTIGT